MIAYKFLRPGAIGPFSGFAWPTPRDGEPGPWVVAGLEAGSCRDGVQACSATDLTRWIREELWAVELDGEIEEGPYKLRASRARLLLPVDGWEGATAHLAEACATRARDRGAGELAAAGSRRRASGSGGRPSAICAASCRRCRRRCPRRSPSGSTPSSMAPA